MACSCKCWHKYPEELPPSYGDYLISVKTETGDENVTLIGTFVNPAQGWDWDDTEIVAWMILPEYKVTE